MSHFLTAAADLTWTRTSESERAKQFVGPRLVAAILAPQPASSPWDSIALYYLQVDEQRREFERDAPKRAATDL